MSESGGVTLAGPGKIAKVSTVLMQAAGGTETSIAILVDLTPAGRHSVHGVQRLPADGVT